MYLKEVKEKFYIWFAWMLPKPLLYWCFIRGCAIATTNEYASTVPDQLDLMTALKRVGIETGFEKKQ